MLDLLDLPPVTDHSAAVSIAALLAAGTPIARRNLNEAMTTAFGGSDADGRWTQRASFEMLEHAVSLHLTSRPYNITSLADVSAASAIMQLLPTQTVRSEEQINLQQFSTPVDIAAIAVLMAAIGADDIVLEPSAGNGLLIVQAPPCASLQLNEIDAKRRERLAGIFPDAIVVHATISPRCTTDLIRAGECPAARSSASRRSARWATRRSPPGSHGSWRRRWRPRRIRGRFRLRAK